MSTAPTVTRGASFTRKRVVRTVSGVASAGLMVGFSLAGASSAMAATDGDCTVDNSVDALTGSAGDIQTLLNGTESVICLSGTFLVGSTLTYDRDVTIYGLSDAVLDGGGTVGILEDQGDHILTVENLRLTNGSVEEGGAIDGYGVEVVNSQFDNNQAIFGAAIRAYWAEIYDSVFVDNDASLGGAVVANYVLATRTTFTTNTAIVGGAILGYDAVYSDSSTFESNAAEYFGGAIAGYNLVEIRNSTFVDNTATDEGGYAGAVFAQDGSVIQSTFLDNTASYGQSIAVYDGSIDLRGNIFAGSTSSAHLAKDGGTITDLGANLFTTSQATESDLSSVQPTSKFSLTKTALFNGATLADNGGPTQTVALHGASPALSAVPADPDSMTEDQRGVARPAVSDAGAYEYTGAVAVLAATGSAPAGWLAGAAALLLAGGAAVLGFARKTRRSI